MLLASTIKGTINMANKNNKKAFLHADIDNTTENNTTKEEATSPSFADQQIFTEIEQAMKDGAYRESRKKKSKKDAEPLIVNDPAKNQERVNIADDEDKKQSKKKVYEKTTFLHKLKVLAVLMVLGVFTGSGLGVWYFNFALKSNVDYTTYNPIDYAPIAAEELLAQYGVINTSGWQTQLKQNYSPDMLSAVNNIILCSYSASQASTFAMIGTGEVLSMGTVQTVYSAKTYDGTRYAFESISKGMLTVATCDVLDSTTNEVTIHQGSNATSTSAEWATSGEKMSVSKFKELSGVLPSDPLPYIISDKTVESATEVVKGDDGLYTFTVTLKPIESVLYYYKQVKRSGNLEADPEFNKIEITFTINENWQFVSSSIVEDYKAVKFGIGVGCAGTLNTTYVFDGDVVMPV